LVAASTLFSEEEEAEAEAEAEAADDDDAEAFFAKVRMGFRDRVTRRTNEQRARSIAVDVLKSRWRVQLLIRIIHEMQTMQAACCARQRRRRIKKRKKEATARWSPIEKQLFHC